MTTQTAAHSRSIWQDTRAITPKATMRNLRPTPPGQAEAPQSAAQAQTEKEADRWVAEMMFDHYNG